MRSLMRSLSLGFCLAGFMSLLACSSNPHKAEQIETDLEKKSTVSGDTDLGLKDGIIKMVYEKIQNRKNKS